MSISRRSFLKSGLAAALAGLSPGLLRLAVPAASAATGDYRAAVCIFLQGGNDGSNCLVPLDSDRYSEYAYARSELALSRSALLPITSLTSGESFGLHPQLRGLQSLFAEGRLALLANVGTLRAPVSREQFLDRSVPVPEKLFSHSDQQRQWQSSQADRLSSNAVGWGGRMADSLMTVNGAGQFPSMVSVHGSNLYCEGRLARPASVPPDGDSGLRGFESADADYYRLQSLNSLVDGTTGHPLIDAAAVGARRMLDEQAFLSSIYADAPPLLTAFPSSSVGSQLRRVAQLIQARDRLGLGRQLFFVSLGTFDTHAAQLPNHAKMLSQLNAAMTAFYRATEELGVASQVLTFTLSEFGRTVSAANGGSDHGWGSHHMVMGGSVRGGDIYGQFPSLRIGGADDSGDKGRLIPTTSVDQYAATIAAWMGVSDADVSAIFPDLVNFPIPRLAFV